MEKSVKLIAVLALIIATTLLAYFSIGDKMEVFKISYSANKEGYVIIDSPTFTYVPGDIFSNDFLRGDQEIISEIIMSSAIRKSKSGLFSSESTVIFDGVSICRIIDKPFFQVKVEDPRDHLSVSIKQESKMVTGIVGNFHVNCENPEYVKIDTATSMRK